MVDVMLIHTSLFNETIVKSLYQFARRHLTFHLPVCIISKELSTSKFISYIFQMETSAFCDILSNFETQMH